MKQPIFTPELKKCSCGEIPKIMTWSYRSCSSSIIYIVQCPNGHFYSKYCETQHRAICLWNNRVNDISKQRMFGVHPQVIEI